MPFVNFFKKCNLSLSLPAFALPFFFFQISSLLLLPASSSSSSSCFITFLLLPASSSCFFFLRLLLPTSSLWLFFFFVEEVRWWCEEASAKSNGRLHVHRRGQARELDIFLLQCCRRWRKTLSEIAGSFTDQVICKHLPNQVDPENVYESLDS